ncbi:MAG: thioredoxin family protein [Elusimicrobiota bacterium]|jgi:peroxiredoxin
MALTPSVMVGLGTKAPPFALPDVATGRTVSLWDFTQSKALLVVFLSRHCPYVQHVKAELGRLARDYAGKGLAMVGIASNDAQAYPEDSPANLKAMIKEEGWTFPVLFDRSQEIAASYLAACTPDYFLYDRRRRLVYRGQLDSSRPGNGIPVTGGDLREAVDAVLADRSVPSDQKPSVGCSIKWRPHID